MFYLYRELDNIERSGVYFYRLSDKGSFGFSIIRKGKWRRFFRYSKITRKFHFGITHVKS